MAQYEAPSRLEVHNGFLSARLDGSDDRTQWLSTKGWVGERLHLDLLEAFIDSTGPGTTRQSSNVVKSAQWILGGFLRCLVERHGSEVGSADITADDFESYYASWSSAHTRQMVASFFRPFALSLHRLGSFEADFIDAARRPRPTAVSQPVSGFSDEDFDRVVRAARFDVERIIERREAGERLLADYRVRPETLPESDYRKGECLDELATVGHPPARRGVWPSDWRLTLPPMLFLQRNDLAPILVLLTALTGRNPETLKELTVHHVVREDRFVELDIIKRRRGQAADHVAWEIGGSQRRLRTSGGFYLLLIELMSRSREFAVSDQLFCVQNTKHKQHYYPWQDTLNDGSPLVQQWADRRGLRGADGITVTLNAVRTTVERRRAREHDYDLDRSAINNSPDVHFRSYVSADDTGRRELSGVVHDALLELQNQLATASSDEQWLPIASRPPVTTEPHQSERAFVHCRNLFGNPDSPDDECFASFLDCFACPCAVVTDDQIPTLLRLSEELVDRFGRMPLERWIGRYGQVWLALHTDILPSRTPAELAVFSELMPERSPLWILEEPEMA